MLAIVTTHPIQYQVPLWQALARDGRVAFEVWYLTNHGTVPSYDEGFGKTFSWDLDLLAGYPYRFLQTADGATPTGFWRCRLRERLRERLRKCGTRAVWIQGWQVAAYWQAVWEAKAVGAKVWLRAESNDLTSSAWWKGPIKRTVLRELFRRVDAALYIGAANRRFYEQAGIPGSSLHPAPYAVDNARFEAQAQALRGDRQRLRRERRIPEGAFCVLFCGKFIDKKRPMDLIDAVRALREGGRAPDVHLLFVGSGELDGILRSACQVLEDGAGGARREDPRPPATFAGFLNQTEISRAYVAADSLVLPSDAGETWGLVVNEAMASGLPCIASDRCGCAEDLVAPIDARLRFACGDVAGLAEAIATVAAEKPGDDKIAAMIDSHSLEATVRTISALWADMTERGRDGSADAGIHAASARAISEGAL